MTWAFFVNRALFVNRTRPFFVHGLIENAVLIDFVNWPWPYCEQGLISEQGGMPFCVNTWPYL